MIRFLLAPLLLVGLLQQHAAAQSREEKVRRDKEKVEQAGYWIYNDLPTALAESKRSGKPIVAVLRCLPCVECVKLDDELIDGDARVKPLLEQFVRVRIVSTNGLDLSLFQFDTDQSFAVFFLNADGTIYGRFGTRSDRKEWIGDVSIAGLAKAMDGALALHRGYPANRAALLAKRGAKPEFASPEKFPSLREKYAATLNYSGNVVQSCIHCHQIGDALRDLVFERKERMPEALLYPYPHPKILGLILDPSEMATVTRVEPQSLAEQAGFQAGDVLEALAGQPLLSLGDVQWVLNGASPDGAKLTADVRRAGSPLQLTLTLPPHWRRQGDISWRVSTWHLRRRALGGMYLKALDDEERAGLKLPPNTTALRVEHVGQFAPHDVAKRAGFAKGDVITLFDERSDLLRETDVLAYVLREKNGGDRIATTVLRDGRTQALTYEIPK
jgi:serine protease Do